MQTTALQLSPPLALATTSFNERYPPLLDSMKHVNEQAYGLADYFDKF